jgi:hypothetical protein
MIESDEGRGKKKKSISFKNKESDNSSYRRYKPDNENKPLIETSLSTKMTPFT